MLDGTRLPLNGAIAEIFLYVAFQQRQLHRSAEYNDVPTYVCLVQTCTSLMDNGIKRMWLGSTKYSVLPSLSFHRNIYLLLT